MDGRQRSRAIALFALGAVGAALPALLLRGFTVDDALIPARYAANLAAGHGYRFNAAGPSTDGVTPLGWPFLLAPFAGAAAGGALAALGAAKAAGVVAWGAAAGVLAVAVDRVSRRPARFLALALMVASAPLGAWSVAGLETGIVTALACLAVALGELERPFAGAACASLAAALRPELLPWALVIGLALGPGDRPAARASRVALAAGGFLAVVAVRLLVFGHPAPLAVQAKPADLELGANYALACLLLTGPLALVAPLAIGRLTAWPRGLLLAVAAHFVAVAAAGGDWMPLSRLVVPVLPTVALAAAHLASVAGPKASALRFTLALAGELFVWLRVGPAAAGVGRDRLAVLEALRGSLREARVVAALDVGWVGAATPATVVDLAGLTDPAIAALPGSHTNKRLPAGLLDARHADALVLLLAEGEPLRSPWTASRFARGVELRLADAPGAAEAFAPVATSELPQLRYVVLRRVAPAP